MYLIAHKSEITEMFETFLEMIGNLTGHRIKAIWSDNGLEFSNKEMTKLMEKSEILHEKSLPYTPEQNGHIERESNHSRIRTNDVVS